MCSNKHLSQKTHTGAQIYSTYKEYNNSCEFFLIIQKETNFSFSSTSDSHYFEKVESKILKTFELKSDSKKYLF